MSAQTKPYDMTAPGTRALVDDIVHGTFIREGTMVAFPTCFPGASVPIPADESRITALTVGDDHIIYGGTSGRRTHLFYAIFHGVTGVVFDMGTVDGAEQCPAMAYVNKQVLACVNGPAGGRILGRGAAALPFDLIQEWGFGRGALNEVAALPGEPIMHALADGTGRLVVATAKRLLELPAEKPTLSPIADLPCSGRLAVGSAGGVFGSDGPAHLWRFDPAGRRLDRKAVKLPEGDWNNAGLIWARDPRGGLLYTADAAGRLFAFDERTSKWASVGSAPLAPVGPMAVTFDGRLFGFAGEGMARLFSFDPADGQVKDLGVAASVLERRRYGYSFADAVLGRDGQIIFGEDDDLGHLWLYFPRVTDSRTPRSI